MLRLTPATARAFHAATENLAHYCRLTARTLGTTAALLDAQGKVVAESVPAPQTAEEAIGSLRNAAIVLGLLPFASIGQLHKLISLYNHHLATPAEKKAFMGQSKRMRADEAQALYDDFAQELLRRDAERKQFKAQGMAWQVAA